VTQAFTIAGDTDALVRLARVLTWKVPWAISPARAGNSARMARVLTEPCPLLAPDVISRRSASRGHVDDTTLRLLETVSAPATVVGRFPDVLAWKAGDGNADEMAGLAQLDRQRLETVNHRAVPPLRLPVKFDRAELL
jgi:hypothetical protein